MEVATKEDKLQPTELPKEQLEHSELVLDRPEEEVSSKFSTEKLSGASILTEESNKRQI